MDTQIPMYCETLRLVAMTRTDAQKNALIESFNDLKMEALRRDIVTYKAYLRKGIRKSVEAVISTYDHHQMCMHDGKLCDRAHMELIRLIPSDSPLRSLVGDPKDYSSLEHCISKIGKPEDYSSLRHYMTLLRQHQKKGEQYG